MPNANEFNRIAVPGVDIKDGDVIRFVDAGEWVTFKGKDGTERKRLQLTIECAGGYKKLLTLNTSSKNALSDSYGDMTEDWIGKQGLVNVALQNVGGEMKKIVYVFPVKSKKKEREPGIEG